jgi:hypothetical protein
VINIRIAIVSVCELNWNHYAIKIRKAIGSALIEKEAWNLPTMFKSNFINTLGNLRKDDLIALGTRTRDNFMDRDFYFQGTIWVDALGSDTFEIVRSFIWKGNPNFSANS